MSEPASSPDRAEQMLARLAEMDLAAAERAHARLMAAEDAHEIADLGRAYQRLARSLRQTLLLEEKLKRAREAAAREAPRAKPGHEVVRRRIEDLREAVGRVIYEETEDETLAGFALDDLEGLIWTDFKDDDFCDAPLDDHVERYCVELGYPPEVARRWRELAPLADPDDWPPMPAEPAVENSTSAALAPSSDRPCDRRPPRLSTGGICVWTGFSNLSPTPRALSMRK